MDFGLARTVEGDGMTQTGALVGTMEYMSPEQALAKDLDQRSDLFTLGLILYELLTGKMPFRAESALASLIKRTQERAIPVSDHDGTIPAAAEQHREQVPGARSQPALPDCRRDAARSGCIAGNGAAANLRFHPAVKPWGQTIPWPLVTGVATVLLLAIVGYVFPRHACSRRPPRRRPRRQALSLAVIPFQNKSGDAVVGLAGTEPGRHAEHRCWTIGAPAHGFFRPRAAGVS